MRRQARTGVGAVRHFDLLAGACRESGMRLTHQRLEIFREIAGREDHPDAEAIHRSVRARMPTVSLDTVYRTLWRLADIGLISTLGPRRESVRFDPNVTHHHHYVCTRCGRVRDFESAELNALPLPPEVGMCGSVAATHVEARGVCVECTGRAAGATRRRRARTPRGGRREP